MDFNNDRYTKARLDLQTHLHLADMISYTIRKIVLYKGKYEHHIIIRMLDLIESKIKDKFYKDDELVIYLKKARRSKTRVRNFVLIKILGTLDTDYCRLGNEVVEKYRYIYHWSTIGVLLYPYIYYDCANRQYTL